jgi:hypothetical protein
MVLITPLVLGAPISANVPATTTLYVSAAGDPASGIGTRVRPFRTITRALEQARCIRYGCPHAMQTSSAPIVIRVLPGSYLVTFDPNRVAADSTLERGPILMNVSDLSLSGSTKSLDDGTGFPSEVVAPGTETTIRLADGELPYGFDTLRNVLLLIHATHDHGGRAERGDAAVVSGFVFEGTNDLGDVDGAVAVRLVRNYTVTGNILRHLGFIAIEESFAVGTIAGNSIVDGDCLAMGVHGGSKSAPQHATVIDNSARRNGCGGIVISGDGAPVAEYEMGAEAGLFTLDALPNELLTSNTSELNGNRFSDNNFDPTFSFGMRMAMFTEPEPNQTSTVVSVIALDNQVRNNTIGIVADAAFPFRSPDQPYLAKFAGTFDNNDVCNNALAPAIFSLTRFGVLTGESDRGDFKYLQNSVYSIDYSGHDLDGFWYDNPASDPYLLPAVNSLNNVLRVNGTSLRGISTPLAAACRR